ncbi:MAG: hypothetical protein HGB31_02565 [Erysipelotrichaceae bacterium]|nr:hypothetical protein [Erysipelotrichaceae bacterium]
MMLQLLKKSTLILLVSMFIFSNLTSGKVFAVSDPVYEVVVNIDESIGSLSGLFDKISRFNRYGLAVISKQVDPNDPSDYPVSTYGIININGEVVLEPVYSSISDYNDAYWRISKSFTDDNGSNYYFQGLISKETGEFFFELKYNWIPDFSFEKQHLLISYAIQTIDGFTTVKQTFDLIANENGVIREAVLPSGIDLTEYDNVYTFNQAGFNFISGHWEKQLDDVITWQDDVWLVNEYGDAISDFRFESLTDKYVRDDGAVFFSFQNMNHNAPIQAASGLIKLTTQNDQITLEMVIKDPSNYRDVWINVKEKRVYYYDLVNENSGYYDLIDETFNTLPNIISSETNIVCGRMGINQVYKCGLNASDGTVILDQTYDSIYRITPGYYEVVLNSGDDTLIGLVKEDGTFLLDLDTKYTNMDYNSDLNWVRLFGKISINDRNNPGSTFDESTYSYYDLKSEKMVAENVEIDMSKLFNNGYSIVSVNTGYGTSRLANELDEDGNIINSYMEYIAEYTFGIMLKDGSMALSPEYIQIGSLVDDSEANTSYKGYYQIAKYISTETCGERYYDSQAKQIVESKWSCDIWNYGVFSIDDGMVLEPVYSLISFSGSDIIETQHSEFVKKEITQYVDDLSRDELFYSYGLRNTEYGLADLKSGEILTPIYSGFSSMEYQSPQSGQVVLDAYGWMKVYKLNYDGIHDETYYNLVGLVSKEGIVVNPEYRDIYIKNGYLYLKHDDGGWSIKKVSDLSEVITIPADSANGVEIDSIELIDPYILIETKVVSDLESYSEYGVINKNLSLFLPIEYSSITFDGTYWYLEKYDPLTGAYPRAIMDLNKYFIVDFSSNYDSLSEYVGGYAVGQSGVKTLVNLDQFAISSFNSPQSSKFVLNIINKNGIIVGDLSNTFESATLLGEFDGVVKVLVQKEGKFYFGTLSEGSNIIDPNDNNQIPDTGESANNGWFFMLLGGALILLTRKTKIS